VPASNVREALAAAANTVDGVKVSPRFRQYARPGDGSVRMAGLVRDAKGFGWIATWQVWVLAHEDLSAAEKWMDERAVELAEVLSEHMVVASVAPQQLNVGGKTIACVVIEGTREQE